MRGSAALQALEAVVFVQQHLPAPGVAAGAAAGIEAVFVQQHLPAPGVAAGAAAGIEAVVYLCSNIYQHLVSLLGSRRY